MADDETIAEAEGNAAARLYTFITEHPNETPFETEMTPEMIDKHKYFNDDILEIAENMERLLQDIATAEENIAKIDDVLAGRIPEDSVDLPKAELEAIRPQVVTLIENWNIEIAKYEREIENEIEEVRTEYRTRAENLNSRVGMFRMDYEALITFRQGELRRVQQDMDIMLAMGLTREQVAERIQPVRTEEENIRIHLGQYEDIWGDYRLLQEGFAITTWREAGMNFVWGVAEIVAIEIVTAGLATAVTTAAAGTRLAVAFKRASTKLDDVLAKAGKSLDDLVRLLAERYNKLLPKTKEKLDEIFARIKTRYKHPPKSDGNTGRRNPTASATPKCPAGGAVLC